jgi:hypothetical protein
MKKLLVVLALLVAGCGSGGGGDNGGGGGTTSDSIKGTWVEKAPGDVEGTITFNGGVVTREDRSGTYKLDGSALTYTLIDWSSGPAQPIFTTVQEQYDWLKAHPLGTGLLGYTNVVKIKFDSTGNIMTWEATEGTWTPQKFPTTFNKK